MNKNNKKIRLNPDTKQLLQIGDIIDHKILKGFGTNISKKGDDKGFLYEKWVSIHGVERINPLTKKPFIRGDVRNEDNKKFKNYDRAEKKISIEGFFFENWLSPEKEMEVSIKAILRTKKQELKKNNGIPFNLDYEYLRSIFPDNSICPAIKCTMRFGAKDRSFCPSLDRLIPELGYIKGNVCWISMKANWSKGDTDVLEIINFLHWYIRSNLESLQGQVDSKEMVGPGGLEPPTNGL